MSISIDTKNKQDLRAIEQRVVTELLWRLEDGDDKVHFGAFVGGTESDSDDVTIEDLLWAAEHLRKKIRGLA